MTSSALQGLSRQETRRSGQTVFTSRFLRRISILPLAIAAGFVLLLGHYSDVMAATSPWTVLHSSSKGLEFQFEPGRLALNESSDSRWFLQGEFLSAADSALAELQIAIPPGASYQIQILSSDWQRLSEKTAVAGIQTRTGSARLENWRDLRVLHLPIPLLREGVSGAEVLRQQSFRLSFSGAHTGGRSVTSLAERSLALVNPVQAAAWAPIRPHFRSTASSFEGDTWVRIPVTERGLYRITAQQLTSLGLDVANMNPDAIRLYSYGGMTIPVHPEDARNSIYDMQEVPLIREHNGNDRFESDERLLFYGHGLHHLTRNAEGRIRHVEHFYARENIYYLMLGGLTAGRSAEALQGSGGTTYEKLPWRTFIDDNFTNFRNGATDWYGDDFVNANTREYTWPLALNGELSAVSIDYDFVYSTSPSNTRDSLQFLINDQLFWGRGVRPSTAATLHDDLLLSGNEVQLKIRQLHSVGVPVLLDHIELTVDVPPAFVNGETSFESPMTAGAFQTTVASFPQGAYLMDVTHYDSLRVLRTALLQDLVQVDPEDAGNGLQRLYYGCAETAIRDVDRISLDAMPNLKLAANQDEMIVIAPQALADVAQQLVDHRNAEGRIRARLVTLEDVYREFNGGVADPGAVRNFLKYDYESGLPAPALQYALLVGAGHYDPLNRIAGSWPTRFPAWYRNNSMLDELYGRLLTPTTMDVAIGRIPVWSAAELENYVEKLIAYESPGNEGNWHNHMIFVGDDEHGENDRVLRWESDHTQHSEYLIRNKVPEEFDVTRIYSIDFPRVYNPEIRVFEKPLAEKALLDGLQAGAVMVNYIGHGNNTTWTHEYLLNSSKHLSLLPSNGKPSLFIAATCSWAEIDLPIGLALPQQLLSLQNGGAIGIMAATRNTTSSGNDRFAQSLYTAMFAEWAEPENGRITVAEAMRRAKNASSSTNDDLYLYLGDPSLLPGFPEGGGVLNEVLGADGQAVDTLLTLELATLNAQVSAPLGGAAIVSGQAFVEVREAPVPRKYYYELPSSGNYTIPDSLLYEAPGALLYAGQVALQNSQISTSFIMPADFSGRPAPGRIRMYYAGETVNATMGDGLVYNQDVLFALNPDPGNDTQAPQVELLFNGPNWREGDAIAPNSTVYIVLQDSSGLNLTGEIGHRMELEIDGGTPIDMTPGFIYESGSYTQGHTVQQLPYLEPGEHSARVRAFDNFNNPGYAETEFTVLNTGSLRLGDLVNFPNPVRVDTRFTFRLANLAALPPSEVELSVYTTRGRRIFRDQLDLFGNESLYYTEDWRPRDDNGDPLARGVYLYRLKLNVPPLSYTRVDELGNLVSASTDGGSIEERGSLIVE